MKKIILLLMAAIMVLSIVGCTKTTSTTIPQPTGTLPTTPVGPPISFEVLKGNVSYVTSPNVPDAQLAALVSGNNTFAFNLYHTLQTRQTDANSNMFYSPYSISTALAMAYAGANGDTANQMAAALQFTLPQAQLHPAFNDLALLLASRGKNAKGTNGKSFSLNIANALWAQQDYTIQSAYLNTLAQNYNAGVSLMDFINTPEAARITINNWVADQTNQRILNLLPQGSVDTLTRCVLTNAIYFDAAWQYPFAKESTHDGTFNLINGSTVTVPMMNQEGGFKYSKSAGYQAIELPYDGNEIAMDIIMPDAGTFNTFDAAITADKVNGIIGSLNNSFLTLSMPKFSFDSSFSLKFALSALGMPVAFSDTADFSGITGTTDLHISDVLHKAFVAVDEEGTEAAAATGVVIGIAAAPMDSMTVNQPFIFLIRDIQTGAIIFVGKVLNPAQ